MITAPDEKRNYSWAICEVAWYAVMQEDGNFEHHDWEGVVLWQSNTDGQPGSFLQLQGDDNLLLDGIARARMAAGADDEDDDEEEYEIDRDAAFDLANQALARAMEDGNLIPSRAAEK